MSDPHAFLERLAPSTIRIGLERMRACDAALGQPWRAYRSLHVAGTNGKGSTCAMAAQILSDAGLKVGLYTSPHLERVNERIRVDGRELTDAELARGIDAICAAHPPAGGSGDDALTYFEFLTALAFEHFRAEKVDVAVIEVGLGGRLDATNVLTPTACAIATLSFDHREYLGDTLGAIAREKAGILKPGVRAAALTREPEALVAIDEVAGTVGAPLLHAGADFGLENRVLRIGGHSIDDVSVGLAGQHQLGNAALAACAVTLVAEVDDAAIRSGLSSARWPGRLERLGEVLVDGAHNAEGAQALAAELARLERPVHLVFGVLADKDVAAMLGALAPRARSLHAVRPSNARGLAPASYLPLARTLTRAEGCDSLAQALALARAEATQTGGQVVVAGSLYLVGELRALSRRTALA